MTEVIQGFGRPLPANMQDRTVSTWGARAIYTGQQIDIVWDRQTWAIPGSDKMNMGEHKPIVDRLSAWLDKKGLPFLRKQAPTLFPEENRTVSLDDGLFHIEANPQASYGYLYIRAWEAIPDPVPAPSPQKRLEYLRGELRAERISYGELAELQDLIPHIDPSDVELLEAAGVPEFPDAAPTPAPKETAHCMLQLKRGNYIAFAEREHRTVLVELRKTDSRMRGGRITDVLQMNPSAITEGVVYEGW